MEKAEQWITRKHIQHSLRSVKKYKGKKTFAKSLVVNLDKPRTQSEKVLFEIMGKYN